MKKMIIQNIVNYDYTLIDNNSIYVLNIEFYSKNKPNIGDIIYISEKLLNEKNLFAFDEVYDNKNILLDDVIRVIHNNESFYFQRIYG